MEQLPTSPTNNQSKADAPRLVFRTRGTGDIILCDYCQYYKCDWLDYSPSNYPKSCPGIREFWLTDNRTSEDKFKRRTAIASMVGQYFVSDRSWHLDAMKAKNLSAKSLNEVIKEICTWSLKNKFALSGMVDYVPSQDPRTTVQTKLKNNGRNSA